MENTQLPPPYTYTKDDLEAQTRIYGYIQEMEELKDEKMPHFSNQYGERSFNQYVDDSEKILNGYTVSRDAQGKESWQSNMMDNVARAKLRAIVAGVGLRVPEMKFEAINKKTGLRSVVHAEIFHNITRNTYLEGNPTLHSFLETWQTLAHGVLFEYEGYKTGGNKIKRVKSFDSRTGAIETETKYVERQGKPVNVILNPQEFYWWSFYVKDIQDQPRLAWIQYYTKTEVEDEFSKYKNWKYIKDKATLSKFKSQQDSTFFKTWKERMKDRGNDVYEVIRYYSKEEDAYEVWINGVPILRVPLIWGDEEKYYPFAHAIAEPFANANFFVGMSLPAILEAYQDSKNTIINTMIDKLYRSMEVPMLVGLQNKNLFDVTTEWVNQDNRYYVDDVNQVKPMPISGLNSGEFTMLQVIDRGLDQLSVDPAQQGLGSQGQQTATEARIADERARELKGIIYMYLEDLWLQKNRLRSKTILNHYIKDKAVQKGIKDNIISVKDYNFGNGQKGILDIHVASGKSKLLSVQEIDARIQAMNEQGVKNYELISIPVNYFEGHSIDWTVIPESLHNQDRIRKEQDIMDKLQRIVTLFPERFAANKDKFFAELMGIYGDDPETYPEPPPQPSPIEQLQQQGMSPLQEGLRSLPSEEQPSLNIIQ